MNQRHRRILILVLALLAGGILLGYGDTLYHGSLWATGTQGIDLKDNRFTEDETDSIDITGSKHWIQDDYSDEIAALSEQEYYITQENGTEAPFRNELYDETRPGIYVDVVSGEPLFSSKDKFKSGTGWPSFTKPLEPANIVERVDPGPLGDRIEIRSRHADSHLGHLFMDGPPPRGLRYCMNSGALEFIPASELEAEGYGAYTSLFTNTSE